MVIVVIVSHRASGSMFDCAQLGLFAQVKSYRYRSIVSALVLHNGGIGIIQIKFKLLDEIYSVTWTMKAPMEPISGRKRRQGDLRIALMIVAVWCVGVCFYSLTAQQQAAVTLNEAIRSIIFTDQRVRVRLLSHRECKQSHDHDAESQG